MSQVRTANFSQAQAVFRKAGGNGTFAEVDGRASFPKVRPGDYDLLILSNTEPDSLRALCVRNEPHNYPGLETGLSLIDRYFGVEGLNPDYEDLTRSQIRSYLCHATELSVSPGEGMDYPFQF